MSSPSFAALSTEAKANLRLALPLIGAQLTFMSAGTVDTIMAGRLGAEALAAVAVGTQVWLLALVFFMGLTMAISPIVAQRLGAGHDADSVGAVARSALRLGVGLGLLWTLLTLGCSVIVLPWLGLDAATFALARAYLLVVSLTGIPFTLCFTLRNVAEAHGITRVTLAAGIAGLCVNALFDYLLMFGAWGFPALGPAGAAWATVLGGCAMLATYLLLFTRVPALRALRIIGPRPAALGAHLGEILRLGLPIAAIIAAEAWLFTVGSLLVARFGAEVIAAHQIAINVTSLIFMVPMSVGLATTVRVGHAAGAGDGAAVRLRGRTGVLIGVAFALASATLIVLASGVIVSLYTPVVAVQRLAAHFLLFAALFQIFDCIQATTNGALRGLKDTRGPMWVTVLAYWLVGMPLAAGLAFASPLGPDGVWWGFIAGLAVAAAGLSFRFHARRFDASATGVRRLPSRVDES